MAWSPKETVHPYARRHNGYWLFITQIRAFCKEMAVDAKIAPPKEGDATRKMNEGLGFGED